MDEQLQRTWAEVSLSALSHNYHELRSLLVPSCKFMGMVKSDAYGHGAPQIAKELERLGADYLGVACYEEARQLREEGISLPILILGASDPALLPKLLEHDLAQTVFDSETARRFSEEALRLGTRLCVHVKVDTGMTRLGFYCGETNHVELADELAAVCALEGLEPEGIFTHFSDADGSEVYTLRQMTRFLSVLEELKAYGCHFALRHAANSAATIRYPFAHLDMVRPGIALYGHYPDEAMDELCDLRPVLSLHSRIAALRELPVGSFVSYGRTQRLSRNSRLAVLPIGYGDGFFRSLSGRAQVSIGGRRVPILGRICMDMCMVDVTALDELCEGDEVLIYAGDASLGPTVEEQARLADTISYELLCALSKRIPRVYRPTRPLHSEAPPHIS